MKEAKEKPQVSKTRPRELKDEVTFKGRLSKIMDRDFEHYREKFLEALWCTVVILLKATYSKS